MGSKPLDLDILKYLFFIFTVTFTVRADEVQLPNFNADFNAELIGRAALRKA